MKTKSLILVTLAVLLSIPAMAVSVRWTFLGEKLVNDRLDHDRLLVTAARGDFNSIQLRVKGASVDFHKVVVVYANGGRDEIELRNTIPAGGTSRVIDLRGNERIIKEVIFWYDANTIRGRKAVVRVFAKR
jgi:hypothetical protein